MTHTDYNSALLRQIRNSVQDIHAIAEAEPFSLFENAVPREVVSSISKVILTGCGDSYCAGIAAKPVYENAETSQKTGMVPGTPTEALRNIEFSRYYNTYSGWEPLTRTQNMVCAVSISGSPRRPVEALRRINAVGGKSVAFTTNPESLLAKSATYVVPMCLPPCDHAPNVTSYYSSLFSLLMFGLYMGTAKNQIARAQAQEAREGLLRYVDQYSTQVMDTLSRQAYDLAVCWEADGVDMMDFIGDGPDYATAFFGSAKMVESFGGLTTNDDSEGWCHINFFLLEKDNIGTFIIANTQSPAFSRELETIRVACQLRSHVAVITDGDPGLFPENAVVFRTPQPECGWMAPLMQHIPMDFVAAYIGCMRGTEPFRADSPIHQRDKKCNRFRSSKIEII